MAKIDTDARKIDELLTRGVIEVIDKEHLHKALSSGKQLRIKLGIDPTSPNIHIGRAVLLRKLRAFQDLGHKVVFIVGDFTGVIGDTSDKDAERPMLPESEIKKNVKTYLAQAFKILDKKKTEAHYNSKWLKKLGFKEVGQLADHFGLHEMEARENIAKRMKEGKRISFRELLYPLMQGYDSVAVKADVEIGGTDQKFNLLAGRTIQRANGQEPQDILMTEILEGTDGRKMSSSWGNVINLTDEPNDMFGKVMRIEDKLIERYFVLATNVSRETIPSIVAKGPRDAKLELATEIVKLYHGEKGGVSAREEFIRTFSKKEAPSEIPLMRLNVSQIDLVDLIVSVKFASSKSEARRLIEQGGVRVDREVKMNNYPVDVYADRETLLQVGPRKFMRVVSE